MTSYWQKIIADLLQDKSRSGLAILSMAIGLCVLGTMLGMMDLQLRYMDAAHQRARPSHINLILKTDVAYAVADSIAALPDVALVDRLTQFSVRFKGVKQAQWQSATVVVRPEYRKQGVDLMRLLSGQWPSGNGLAVERLSVQATGLRNGDGVELETPSGATAFQVTGMLRHPFVKPPTFGGVVHFFLAPEAAEPFGVAPNTFRQLLVQIKAPYSEQKVQRVATEIRAALGAQGIGVNASLLQSPTQHWGRPFLAGIHYILTVMAWASLALSCVLIFNTVSAMLTQQTAQIGVMKALGARRSTIASLYVSEVLVLAIIALCIAVPLSAWGANVSSRWFLDLFNIGLPPWAVSWHAIRLTCIAGFLAPLLAALFPIWRAVSVSVRQALSSYGLGGVVHHSRCSLWLENRVFSHLPTLYAMTLGHLLRHKARLLWTQSVLVIAGVAFMVIMSLVASVQLTLDNELARSQYSVRLGFSNDQPTIMVKALLRSIPVVNEVELWNRLPAELSLNEQPVHPSGSLGLQLLALPVPSVMYQPMIVAGRWLEPADNEQPVLVLNADTAARNGVQVGDTLSVSLLGQAKRSWQVVGLYRWFAGTGYAVEPVYAPISSVNAVTQRRQVTSFVLLAANIRTLAAEQLYMDTMQALFQSQGIKLDAYTTVAKLQQRQFAQNQFRPVTRMLLGLSALMAAVGIIGLSGALAIAVLQRTREIGVLRALGASSWLIVKAFILEGLLHAWLAWLLSVPLAYLLAPPLAQTLGEIMLGLHLDFTFNRLAVWLWLGAISCLAMIAAMWPAWRATNVVVRESLGY